MIILDTNVVSEFMRPEPDARVVAWLDSIPGHEIWTASIVIGEVAAGISLLPDGARRRRLAEGLDAMLTLFEDRVLSFDTSAALEYGAVVARRRAAGRPISIADAQIAAIAITNEGALATRNTADFAGLELAALDPWQAGAPDRSSESPR